MKTKCPRCNKKFRAGEEKVPGLAYSLEQDSFYRTFVHKECTLFDDPENPAAWRYLGFVLNYRSSYRWVAQESGITILYPYFRLKYGGIWRQVRVYRSETKRLILDAYGFSYAWNSRTGWLQLSQEKTQTIAKEFLYGKQA